MRHSNDNARDPRHDTIGDRLNGCAIALSPVILLALLGFALYVWS